MYGWRRWWWWLQLFPFALAADGCDPDSDKQLGALPKASQVAKPTQSQRQWAPSTSSVLIPASSQASSTVLTQAAKASPGANHEWSKHPVPKGKSGKASRRTPQKSTADAGGGEAVAAIPSTKKGKTAAASAPRTLPQSEGTAKAHAIPSTKKGKRAAASAPRTMPQSEETAETHAILSTKKGKRAAASAPRTLSQSEETAETHAIPSTKKGKRAAASAPRTLPQYEEKAENHEWRRMKVVTTLSGTRVPENHDWSRTRVRSPTSEAKTSAQPLSPATEKQPRAASRQDAKRKPPMPSFPAKKPAAGSGPAVDDDSDDTDPVTTARSPKRAKKATATAARAASKHASKPAKQVVKRKNPAVLSPDEEESNERVLGHILRDDDHHDNNDDGSDSDIEDDQDNDSNDADDADDDDDNVVPDDTRAEVIEPPNPDKAKLNRSSFRPSLQKDASTPKSQSMSPRLAEATAARITAMKAIAVPKEPIRKKLRVSPKKTLSDAQRYAVTSVVTPLSQEEEAASGETTNGRSRDESPGTFDADIAEDEALSMFGLSPNKAAEVDDSEEMAKGMFGVNGDPNSSNEDDDLLNA